MPPELLSPDHPVWNDRDLFIAFMKARSWGLPPQERLGGGNESSPENRRRTAAEEWAIEQALTDGRGRPDRPRLREMGLLPTPPSQRDLYERYLRS
jgi:hypothetical protein